MQVLVPNAITSAMLVSSSVPEPDTGEGTAYNATTAYAVNDLVYSPVTHRRYRAIIASTGRNPDTDTTTPAAWVDLGPTNRWAMLDDQVSTQTIETGSITVTLDPGTFNAISLFGLSGDDISVTVWDGPTGSIVYEHEQALDDSMPADYYEHFYSPYRPLTDLTLDDIPIYVNPRVTITVNGGDARIGALLLGDLRTLGCTSYGATAELVDYSYIKVDEFGRNTIIKRKNAKDMRATVKFATQDANQVVETMAELLAVPCVWIASTATPYGGLRCYGLGSGGVSFDGPTQSVLNLTVRGLI